ncbi:hypothetical protein [Spirosoma foliorum]|uniref:Uncharacterized protein n=1 Tax=Spirosoma foliorum TaxID=2710596 RepID=A0A7G5GRH1_9BACT|nr:hypothetical protein [Spirosoma foliorum]QMW01463.1 hypothetical protein H3H32_26400 [Spirosoma foliorum]
MEKENKADYNAFVKAVKKLGMLDKNNQATLHHSAVSTKDWSELNEVGSKQITNTELPNDESRPKSN